MKSRRTSFAWAIAAALCLWADAAHAIPKFVLFESGQVRPLALSPDGSRLYAVNTPDNRLEVFSVNGQGLTPRVSIPVGMEPVAVAVRNAGEVWVTNLLSDSVSIIDVSDLDNPRVVRTLLVGDEPRDIVFAGSQHDRAFITTAHRGQNVPYDPQLTTPGVGRADVWVFNANNLGGSLSGSPVTIISLFTDTPRALAVSPNGSRVYAAGFHTGNRTTVVGDFLANPQPPPPPTTNFEGLAQNPSPLIVKYNGSHWVDEINRIFDSSIAFSLPDKDVFVIDANTNPPALVPGADGSYAGVGTVLYNMAVNPVSGRIYVSNTDALNDQRFEGPGIFAGHTVRGKHNRHRITVLGLGGAVQHRHLNKHINFASCCAAIPNAENDKSLALPLQMAVSSNGNKLFVAAMGSSKIGIYNTAALESDTFVPSTSDQITVSGGGPTGLVLDEPRGKLYVLTRFDNGISIVDVATKQEVGKRLMFNPEPAKIVNGRRFLYDARLSSHGDSSCASCHVFADNDSLAWDLGNPDGQFEDDPNPIGPVVIPPFAGITFAPMKGPMTTQSLRGMANQGPMHWRGDRTGAFTQPNAQPDSGAFNEREAFRQFQAGFVDLLGRPGDIPAEDMDAFTDFILQLTYPPNPIRSLNNSLTQQQQQGKDFFVGNPSTGTFNPDFSISFITCESCHTLDPSVNASAGVDFPGLFGGSGGLSSSEPPGTVFKIPHLRNLYTKVGMFGLPEAEFLQFGPEPVFEPIAGLSGFQGDQIRGFGLLHGGAIDTPVRFVSAFTFSQAYPFAPPGANAQAFPPNEAGTPLRRSVEAFLYAIDSNLKPIVGQQVTLTPTNGATVGPRINLLIARAEQGDCDLVAKGKGHGFFYVGSGKFKPDKASKPLLTDAALRAEIINNNEFLTYTCVPPGSGKRIGIDRDDDGTLDGDE
jgi:DNA-binding beta-propeller fold protein YncE